jgi:hypothetical protein
MLWKQDHETGGGGQVQTSNIWGGFSIIGPEMMCIPGGTQGPLVQPDQLRPGQDFKHMVAHP